MKKKIIFTVVFFSMLTGFAICANAIMVGRDYVVWMENDKAEKYQEFLIRMASKEAGRNDWGVTTPSTITITHPNNLEEYRRSIK